MKKGLKIFAILLVQFYAPFFIESMLEFFHLEHGVLHLLLNLLTFVIAGYLIGGIVTVVKEGLYVAGAFALICLIHLLIFGQSAFLLEDLSDELYGLLILSSFGIYLRRKIKKS
ncbi:MAG: hypothetical protein WC421_11475 [Elusimicrobiales bacterium]